MLTRLVTVSILSTLTTVITLSTVSIMSEDTVSQGRGSVNLDPTAAPGRRADLDAMRQDFPRYLIEVEPIPGGRRYIARRTQPGPGQDGTHG